ncbi:MAG: site-specific DNA-methyltransferase [Armatimonadota bacterium]|nr:site-specific DNA-methyltransferase [Armatimonadota bacterium]
MSEYVVSYPGEIARLEQGECLNFMPKVQAESVDVVVTSSPYNLGVIYNSYDYSGSREDYEEWIRMWAREGLRVLSSEGSPFLNMGGKPSNPWVPIDTATWSRDEGFKLQNVTHWIKSIAITEAKEASNGV